MFSKYLVSGLFPMALFLLFLAPTTANAKESPSTKELKLKLQKNESVVQSKKQRDQLIKTLIAIVTEERLKPNFRDPKLKPAEVKTRVKNWYLAKEIRLRAVEILGQIRASEAVPVLVEYLDKIQPDLIDAKTLYTVAPCVPALVYIGKPATIEVLKELRKPQKKWRHLLLITVLHDVEGLNVGRLILNETIASTKNVQERKHLQAAKTLFETCYANKEQTALPLYYRHPQRHRCISPTKPRKRIEHLQK